jgi:hypothetical protein
VWTVRTVRVRREMRIRMIEDGEDFGDWEHYEEWGL